MSSNSDSMVQRESILKRTSPPQSLTIAVIGDIHDAWDADDEDTLKHLGVDLVLFVGDFGNEAVEVVRQVANLNLPKAAVLGNHDAWYSATDWGRKKCPYDRSREDRVQQQLDLLGPTHVGYSKLDFPEFGVSVVGARPFSWGGSDWKTPEFYLTRYGISDFAASTDRIVASAQQTTTNSLIFLGHCGPFGLGDRPEDICGRDWQPLGGDHGDPDFAAAIAKVRQLGKQIPLVAFGHMHHQLRHTKTHLRQALVTDASGTVYVNAACVPRIIRQISHCRRNFTLVSLVAGVVQQVTLVWVDQDFVISTQAILYQQATPLQR